MILYFLFQIFWFYLKTYVFGACALITQLFFKHKILNLNDIPLQTGKVAIVTGGSAGIGFYTSRALVAKNIHVIIGGKSETHGQAAIKEIRKDYPNAKVDFIHLDLASLQSVRDFADEFLSRDLDLHILINNAGIMFPPYSLTVDGYESQLQVNYLSHFYLTQLLLDKLKVCGEDTSWSRVVNVASYIHCIAHPDGDKLGQRIHHWAEYSSHKEYADSKFCIIAAMYNLDRQLREDNARVSVCALHPGVVNSQLIQHNHWTHRLVLEVIASLFYLTAERGADTSLYTALSPEVEGQSGRYYDNSQSTRSLALTYDEELQQKLWTNSILLVENAGH